MPESYQMTVNEGDIVHMPNGVVGIVNHWDIVLMGHCKEVRVYPLTNWFHRLFLAITKKNWFYDKEINTLKPLSIAPCT